MKMIFLMVFPMVFLAILCAGVLATALHPMMIQKKQGRSWLLLTGMACTAFALYIALGSPDVKMAPALFETSGTRFEQRLASQRELIILEALSGNQDHVPLLLELGTVRIQGGHPQDALQPLERALKNQPSNINVKEALGAAHYALALTYAIQPRKDAKPMALSHFETEVKFTPKSADFYQRLHNDRATYQIRNAQTK